MGVRLLERTTRAVSPTDAGREFLPYCQDLLEAANGGQAALERRQQDVTGTLRLAAPPSLSDVLLVPLVERFLQRHPGAAVKVLVTDRHLDLVEDEVDVSLRVGRQAESSLIVRTLTRYRHVVIAAPSYLASAGRLSEPSDLRNHNLTLAVEYTNGAPAKLNRIRHLCDSDREGARIVYTGTRRDAEEIADFISSVIELPAVYYHAGLPAEDRARIQNAFLAGASDVIVATNAFGMGIDRADIRQMIHFSVPGSLEAYYQEAGRAGRDGEAARATVLYDPHDRALQEYFIESSTVSLPDLHAINNSIWRTLHKRQTPTSTAASETVTSLEAFSAHTGLHPVQIKVGLATLERAGAAAPWRRWN